LHNLHIIAMGLFSKTPLIILGLIRTPLRLYSRVDQVVVKCVVETTGADHADKIFKGLRDKGYPLTVED